MTGAEPLTLENPLESAVYEELTCATSTPSVIGVDEEELEDPEGLERSDDPDDPDESEDPEDPEDQEDQVEIDIVDMLEIIREQHTVTSVFIEEQDVEFTIILIVDI